MKRHIQNFEFPGDLHLFQAITTGLQLRPPDSTKGSRGIDEGDEGIRTDGLRTVLVGGLSVIYIYIYVIIHTDVLLYHQGPLFQGCYSILCVMTLVHCPWLINRGKTGRGNAEEVPCQPTKIGKANGSKQKHAKKAPRKSPVSCGKGELTVLPDRQVSAFPTGGKHSFRSERGCACHDFAEKPRLRTREMGFFRQDASGRQDIPSSWILIVSLKCPACILILACI